MKCVLKNNAGIILCSIIISCMQACQSTTAPPPLGKLISIEQLDSLLQYSVSHYKLIDIRKAVDYERGHIPTAIRTWRPDYENKDAAISGMMADRNTMQQLLRSWGVLDTDTLILYDEHGNTNACRLWWILKQYGFEKTKILDGGYHKWQLEACPSDSLLLPQPQPSTLVLAALVPHLSADVHSVQRHLERGGILLDSRTPEEYRGEIRKGGAARGGHIPTAIRFDWSELVAAGTGEDGTFRSRETIQQKLDSLQISPSDTIIIYCQSGVRSACTTFALSQLMGYPHIQNYDGSWLQWSHSNLPIESLIKN